MEFQAFFVSKCSKKTIHVSKWTPEAIFKNYKLLIYSILLIGTGIVIAIHVMNHQNQ